MLSDLFFRVRSLFRAQAAETELDDELRFHCRAAAREVCEFRSDARPKRCAASGSSLADSIK